MSKDKRKRREGYRSGERDLELRAREAVERMPRPKPDENTIVFGFRWYWWSAEEQQNGSGDEVLLRRIDELAGLAIARERLEVDWELPPPPEAVNELEDDCVVHLVQRRASVVCPTRVTVRAARAILCAGVIDPAHFTRGYRMAREVHGRDLMVIPFAFAALVGDWNDEDRSLEVWRWGEGGEEGPEPLQEGGIGGVPDERDRLISELIDGMPLPEPGEDSLEYERREERWARCLEAAANDDEELLDRALGMVVEKREEWLRRELGDLNVDGVPYGISLAALAALRAQGVEPTALVRRYQQFAEEVRSIAGEGVRGGYELGGRLICVCRPISADKIGIWCYGEHPADARPEAIFDWDERN